jgi:hypothetical protein
MVTPPAPASAFGFRIRSSEVLRFARSGGGIETLEVTVAPAPRARPATAPLADWTLAGVDHDARGTLYQLERQFEYWASDVGAYRIDAETSRVEIPQGHDDIVREQRLWGIPAALCFMQRGDVPLHAAAVEVEGRAVVLAAPRRHGKTTLALAFHERGYRVLSEDLACCRPTAEPTLLPGPTLLRLRPDVYGGRPPAGTHVVATRPDRVYLSLDDASRGSGAPVPIAAIVLLHECAQELMMRPIPAAEAIPDLWALSFRLPTVEACTLAFRTLTWLVSPLPIWDLYRPARLDCLGATVERIVEVCRR